ncbi:hypothetical protein bsdtw1_00196 [Clostridium fungisolvens]|uniref:Uncharacterized protein n=1 Tax=Clostridium fungisolvens TaxID=1604897 RepID=A0A6V8SBB7_9CLOT|nr:hypothetical protein bsdtw1_00196 [Clostridium fungisolvens]
MRPQKRVTIKNTRFTLCNDSQLILNVIHNRLVFNVYDLDKISILSSEVIATIISVVIAVNFHNLPKIMFDKNEINYISLCILIYRVRDSF